MNDTDGYVGEDFESRIHHLLDVLFDAYPDSDNNLKINWLLFRYIDAVDFDYEKYDVFSFLRENLKIDIKVYEELFKDTGVSSSPLGFDLKFSFPAKNLKMRFI